MSRLTTFTGFVDEWTPIAAGSALQKNKALAIVVAGVPVVLFRDVEGHACALVDRCPHRSVKLSLGKVCSDGTLQCAFHGWRFAGDGACQAIPLNPGLRRDHVQAQAIACAERGGLIWLFAGTKESAPPLQTPISLDAAGWLGSVVIRDWNAHWSRAIQTMLDVAHLPFVHPRTIGVAFGRGLGAAADTQLKFARTQKDTSGFRFDWRLEAAAKEGASDAGWLEFLPPNGMTLGIPQKGPGRQSMLHIWCAPLAENRSRMIVVSRRNFGRFNPILALFDLLTPVILAEDRRNIETIWPAEVPGAGEELSVPSDAPTIAFARYYRKRFAPHDRE